MPRGGSKPGERRGGRTKGTRNKRTQVFKAEVEASGETPLEYMMRVMHDPKADEDRRDEMARAAAPYVHPKLAAIAATVDQRVTVDVAADAAAEHLIAELARRRRARRNGADPDHSRITEDQSQTTH